MIGQTGRRASRLLLLTAAIVLCGFAATAWAAGNSISIKPPTNAKVNKNYSFTITGFAGQIERLYFFDDVQQCGPNPHVEHAVHNANGDDYVVNGSFNKVSHGWRSPKATSYNVCAYLVQISQPFNPKNGVLLRASKSFSVS